MLLQPFTPDAEVGVQSWILLRDQRSQLAVQPCNAIFQFYPAGIENPCHFTDGTAECMRRICLGHIWQKQQARDH